MTPNFRKLLYVCIKFYRICFMGSLYFFKGTKCIGKVIGTLVLVEMYVLQTRRSMERTKEILFLVVSKNGLFNSYR